MVMQCIPEFEFGIDKTDILLVNNNTLQEASS